MTGATLRAMEARCATHKITDAALDRMAALVEALASEREMDTHERMRIAREFDLEIERAADNPTLRSMILSLSIIGQERRGQYARFMWLHPGAGRRRVPGPPGKQAGSRQRGSAPGGQAFLRPPPPGGRR